MDGGSAGFLPPGAGLVLEQVSLCGEVVHLTHTLAAAPPVTEHSSKPDASGHPGMSHTPKPDDLAEVAEEQQLAGRHQTALNALRPYFVARCERRRKNGPGVGIKAGQ